MVGWGKQEGRTVERMAQQPFEAGGKVVARNVDSHPVAGLF